MKRCDHTMDWAGDGTPARCSKCGTSATELSLPNRPPEERPLPAELPEHPKGWARRQNLHLKVQGGGIAVYSCYDADGREMPFAYTYDTRPPGSRGFTLPDVDKIMGWHELRLEWPKWLARTNPTEKDARLQAAAAQVPK